MKSTLGFYMALALFVLTVFAGFTRQKRPAGKPFKVYAFMPYAGYVKDGVTERTNFKELQDYLAGLGIGKYDLIYENRITDYPDGNKAHGIINRSKLGQLAKTASAEPGVFVSLDLEGWNRFDTLRTPEKLLNAIAAFKEIYPAAQVGLYATVPQNTYGYPKDTDSYNRLNRAYARVAAAVDYFSPSLYNYKTADFMQWKKFAVYNIEACKKYGYPGKKVIPYITPEINADGHERMLDYYEMLYRLQTLYNLGADGCLLWGSSGTRDAQGNRIVINENEGWLKAVRDFIKQHP